MFTKAIVRIPGKSLAKGLTTAKLGLPDYKLALKQHRNYISKLQDCGLDVIELKPLEQYPDSVFIEDVALLTKKAAIITNPGAVSRKGEIKYISDVLKKHFHNIEEIKYPGTVEAGDVMMVGEHYYIGISERTNTAGAYQLIKILEKYGMTGSTVQLKEVLHLKTGVAYLENNMIAASGEFINKSEFKNFKILEIPSIESYATNCIWVNGKVIIPDGFPRSKKVIEQNGLKTEIVNVSEFQKIDGGLSCLSLRF